MPRRGGEADKFGARYEGRWTARQILYILMGMVDSITVESVDETGFGVEFVLHRSGKRDEVHQVKRQPGINTKWSLGSLQTNGVLEAAQRHVLAGRDFVFVSTVPPESLEELCDRARRSADVSSFQKKEWLNKALERDFLKLAGADFYGSPELAWQVLRGVRVHVEGEHGLNDVNSAFAQMVLDGASPKLAVAGLGDLVLESLAVELDANAINERLGEYRLSRKTQFVGSAGVIERVAAVTDSWKGLAASELLKPEIKRVEAEDILQRLIGESRLLFAVGTAGTGKSAVLYQTLRGVEEHGWSTLAFRLDRLGRFQTTIGLGEELHLDVSPVVSLAAASNGAPCLLVIDQLDAVSAASGRLPEMFDTVAALLNEARAFPNMRVLLACRKFDVENDHRILSLVKLDGAVRVDVASLSDNQISDAVIAMNLNASDLSMAQRRLLSVPLNLVLLQAVADEQGALSFATTKDLFDRFWERKRRDCRRGRQPVPRFEEVVRTLASEMSVRQQLNIPLRILDSHGLNDDADALASEGVLVRERQKIAFFHEAFFDYAFARQWMTENQSLVGFLLDHDQELFRRAQVRQVLTHLREEEPARFIRECEALLTSPDIRYHLKHVVLALLRSLLDPVAGEWKMIERVAATHPRYIDSLWFALRTAPWFRLLDSQGVIEAWLTSDQSEDHTHAMNVMMAGVQGYPDRIAEILAPFEKSKAQYLEWLRWMVRFGKVYESRALFELLRKAIAQGRLDPNVGDLWSMVHGLGQHQPEWATDLLTAYIAEQPSSMQLDERGRVRLLDDSEHSLLDLVEKAAAGAPFNFCKAIVPYLLKAMAASPVDQGQKPIEDLNFSHRRWAGEHRPTDLAGALQSHTSSALKKIAVERDADEVAEVLRQLQESPYETAQWLLYQALQANGERYAEQAAAVLLEGPHRFLSGNIENGVWASREVIAAIAPHLESSKLQQLESTIVGYCPPGVKPRSGWHEFTLLSALPGVELTPAAAARLAELQSEFDAEQPAQPMGVTGGFIGPPVPESEASTLTDDEWIDLIAKYCDDRTDFFSLRGGAHEQAQVLQSLTQAYPERFGRLALRFTGQENDSYGNAILMGLAQTGQPADAELVFNVIRHFSSLRHDSHDRWLSWPLRSYLDDHIPEDIVRLVVDRALSSADPSQDSWNRTAHGGKPYYGGDIYTDGINTGRGQLVESLTDMLHHDNDGSRAALIIPQLSTLARDSSLAVRSCVARLTTAALSGWQSEAEDAFRLLIDADDRLLASRPVSELVLYLGSRNPGVIEPVVRRMLSSEFEDVRQCGGRCAVVAGLQFGLSDFFLEARDSEDPAIRLGAAEVCAVSVASSGLVSDLTDALANFFDDPDERVREASMQVAPSMRDLRLTPFRELITSLISSQSFEGATAQLLITLDHASEDVSDIIIMCSQRFIERYGVDVGNLATGAAGNARKVAALLLRAYAQASDTEGRGEVMDVLDELLLNGAYGVEELVDATERN